MMTWQAVQDAIASAGMFHGDAEVQRAVEDGTALAVFTVGQRAGVELTGDVGGQERDFPARHDYIRSTI